MPAIRLIAALSAIGFIAMAILLVSTAMFGMAAGLILTLFISALLWLAFMMLTRWQDGRMFHLGEVIEGEHEEAVERSKPPEKPRSRFRRLRKPDDS